MVAQQSNLQTTPQLKFRLLHSKYSMNSIFHVGANLNAVGHVYVYENIGNTVSNGVWSYSYDAENRLTAAYSNSLCIVSNAYDHASRQVLKVTSEATHTFTYDGWLPIVEVIEAGEVISTNTYVWGKDLSGSFQGAGGIGGLLAVKQGNAWYFLFYDANGNITAYFDESGSVVAEYAYDAFGYTISQSGSMADSFRYRFSTKYYDAETELYYYGLRFYSRDLHRWLNRDPIEERGGLNLYGFCGNDGVNQVDSLGETPITTDVWWETYDRTIIVVEAFKKTGDFLWASELKSSGRGPIAKVKPCDLFLVFVNVPRDDSDDEQSEEFPLVSSQDTGVYKNRGDHNVVPRRTYSKGGRSYTKLWDSLPAQMALNALANPINVVYKDGKVYRYKENDQLYIHSVKGKDLKKTSQVTVWVDILDAKGNLSQKHSETIKIEVSR